MQMDEFGCLAKLKCNSVSVPKTNQCYSITLSQYLLIHIDFRMGTGQLPVCGLQCCHNSVDPIIETTEL